VWLARLDVLAGFFRELKNAGVAPLFRVMHEMNDGWVWWAGHGGQSGSAALYRITHDYLVNVKGLDNIIWVWNLKDIGSLPQDVTDFDPGSSYYDVAALDMYVQGYTDGNYTAMKQAAAGKPMGIAECEVLPDSGTLAAQPLWSYIAMWPDYFNLDTTVIPALFNDPRVVTLENMPGW
jgi:beta-mannanase